MVKIEHTEGYKDEYKVEVTVEENKWSPTNKELFVLVEKLFESEEHEFGEDGYGSSFLWFYLSLIQIGEEEKAREAYGLRGWQAKEHFEEAVDEHADEVIAALEELKEEVK